MSPAAREEVSIKDEKKRMYKSDDATGCATTSSLPRTDVLEVHDNTDPQAEDKRTNRWSSDVERRSKCVCV